MRGAHVEIVEHEHESGSGVLAVRVRVTGTDVGAMPTPLRWTRVMESAE